MLCHEQVGTHEEKEEKKRKALHRKEEANATKHFQDPVSALSSCLVVCQPLQLVTVSFTVDKISLSFHS